MTIRQISDPKTPVGEVLDAAGTDGVIIESTGSRLFALLPLDDELVDYLIERKPKFREECREIGERMRAGQFYTYDERKRLLTGA